MITKEICRDFAKKTKEETGKFPNKVDWVVKNGYPCSYSYLRTLFDGSYNNFRDYCEEPHKIRTEAMSLEWIKSNCTIDENQCWNWNRSSNSSGYGQLIKDKKIYQTHRLTYEISNRHIPIGLLVRHKCDNKKCCNPTHLELGTHSDNNIDTWNRKDLSYKHYTNTELSTYTRNLTTLEEKINFYLENIVVTDSNCWESSLLKSTKYGYYHIRFNNRLYKLHRLILANKLNKDYDILDIVRHTCNNKSCINPEHLIEGSRSDNALDNREYSKNSKLTEEKVMEIKIALLGTKFEKFGDKGKFDKFWAEKLNVKESTISSVRLGKSWKDIKVIGVLENEKDIQF